MNDRTTQQASLGCGTLILIALIVLMFSGRGVSEVKDEVKRLQTSVAELEAKIDAQDAVLKRVDGRVARLADGAGNR
jgi:cell division protein FtsL